MKSSYGFDWLSSLVGMGTMMGYYIATSLAVAPSRYSLFDEIARLQAIKFSSRQEFNESDWLELKVAHSVPSSSRN
jgi:hypothetical protein